MTCLLLQLCGAETGNKDTELKALPHTARLSPGETLTQLMLGKSMTPRSKEEPKPPLGVTSALLWIAPFDSEWRLIGRWVSS